MDRLRLCVVEELKYTVHVGFMKIYQSHSVGQRHVQAPLHISDEGPELNMSLCE